jgi:HD-GYP domain-containing protein (c-di-GMP phosphodiesterase class II)
MLKYMINDIPEDSYFRRQVYLDDGFIIASPEIPIDGHTKKLLLDWDFRELLSEGEPAEGPPEDLLPFFEKPEENAFTLDVEDEERIFRAVEIYVHLTEFTETLLNRVSSPSGGGIDYQELAAKAEEFCGMIRRENRYLLQVMRYKYESHGEVSGLGQDPSPAPFPRENYQISHTVNSLILSVIIGDYLKFNNEELVDLAVAALLHEMGMFHIPADTYLTDKPLTQEEHRAILSHPVLGFNMLKSLNFPRNIQLAVLEHHEQENGSGYPQRLTGGKISRYAKIIAVACSYEAITAVRPYKDVKDGRSGILDLLKNENGRYDEAVVRALVYSLSMYPIGSRVQLSDGRIAHVVDVDPGDPSCPIVHIDGQGSAALAVVKTSCTGPHILRSLPEKNGPEKWPPE